MRDFALQLRLGCLALGILQVDHVLLQFAAPGLSLPLLSLQPLHLFQRSGSFLPLDRQLVLQILVQPLAGILQLQQLARMLRLGEGGSDNKTLSFFIHHLLSTFYSHGGPFAAC